MISTIILWGYFFPPEEDNMKSKIVIEFEHGETTCAYAEGKLFCRFLRCSASNPPEQYYYCSHFDVGLSTDSTDCALRSKYCLDAFGPKKEV